MNARAVLWVCLFSSACASKEAPVAADASPTVDAQAAVRATDYCESIAESFCAFYMRCGRMHAADQDECLGNFLESCNSKYEPGYVGLELEGFLEFDLSSVDSCAAHLSTVACEKQVFELTGPCRELWAGQVSAGGACGLGLEYFVCDSQSECVIAPDFCGSCYPLVEVGQACVPGQTSCGPAGFCQEGTCKARTENGEICGDLDLCMVGSSCDAGNCVGPQFVALGDSCDRARRCPYMSECIAGTCFAAVLQGQACSNEIPCGTGFCDLGICTAPQADGSSCTAASQCASSQCMGKTCQPRPSSCLGG